MAQVREFVSIPGLTLRERNAKRKEMAADGWSEFGCYGGNLGGWTLEFYKGEKPMGTRSRFNLLEGTMTVSPMYRNED